ncbi:hypothetical protein N7462_002661 [Penicillium macrosclerotiorum]|uniref:uncharacterized protein n=1 Tax=Penicillium macrosclerotiorum TaxID=303699 RepID=UPI0025469B07|nr:uncharacterized protein N7462_002661 [Penicillium macrosclerotiorum]KAJ5693238.1 hypothetical protein N7462_002661 [Penicillium macrosclerotiorum]
MEDNDDDYFSDDFDSLPPGTLYELEQNAFQATQTSAVPRHDAQVVSNETLLAPARPTIHRSASLKPPPRLHTGLTNEYDVLEVGELEAEVHDNVKEQLALPQDRHALVTGSGWPVNGRMDDIMEIDDDYAQAAVYQTNTRMEELEREKEQMRRDLAEAKILAETKAGEIAIIRAKQTRMVEEYDRQLAALRKSMADEMAKHKEEVEAAMSEGKMLATENIFLQHDLAEEAYQLRNYKSKHRAEEKVPPITPKKSRVLPFRDGFEDDEIAVASPSRSATRSKRTTPTVPGKRKRRPSIDSPVPLQLSPAEEPTMIDAPVDTSESVFEDERKPHGTFDRKNGSLKQLLNHRMVFGQETDLEAFSRLFFPSDPTRSISSIIMDELARSDRGHYLLEYVYTIKPLWERALAESFLEPVPRFMSIARYVLMMDDAPLLDLITPLVGVLQDAVEANAVPRFKYSPTAREKARILRQTPQSDLKPQVDSTEALRLLCHIACGLLHVKGALESFWAHIRHTFILVMLHGSQHLKDIMLILHLLSTSIRPNSFGPIMSSEQHQADVQKWIVDRLSFMLSEAVLPDEDQEAYTAHDICAMRLEVLLLLETLASSPVSPSREHGSVIIATHPNALARLFRSMHDELDALYSSPPEQDLRVAMVNGLMRLIFGVMRRHGPSINMQEKLACVPGSKQKHLVVLTRLAFCDGSVLEAGIEDETVDMAHELLEEWTNPQEAHSLAAAFPSSRRD